MGIPASPITGPQVADIKIVLEGLVRATRESAVATITAAIINARGKPTSIEEVMEINRNVNFALHPDPRLPGYKEWNSTKAEALAKVYD
jgi:hypothetical protein